MMQYFKYSLLWCTLLFAVLCNRAHAQLPSLFGDSDDESNVMQSTVLKPGENPEDKIRSQIFIKTTVSKRDCYVGEPVLVVYQLYTSLYCQPKVVKQPLFTGCSLVEMTTDEPEYLDKNNGKMYRVLLIRKVQLTPLQEGELIIPQAVVNNEVGFTSTENPYQMKNYSAAISSKLDSIHVKPLPTDKPADYSGIAGNKFTIAAKVDSTTVPQGENDVLQITITGEGNIEAIGQPDVKWPNGIEHFGSTDSQHINKMNFPVRGDKTFTIPFIGTQQGIKVIPEVTFTFFNTTSQHFETVSTQPITINVVHALPEKKLDEHIVTDDISNRKYLWFVPGIAVVVISIWLISNKKKEASLQQAKAPNEGKEDNKQPATSAMDGSVLHQEKTPAHQPGAAPDHTAENVAHEQEVTPPVKPDFKLLLQALNETEDNYLFFTNAKTLLTAILQHTLASTEQDEHAVLLLLEDKNATLATEAKNIYAACNQYLYSPVVDDNARTALIDRLNAVINEVAIV